MPIGVREGPAEPRFPVPTLGQDGPSVLGELGYGAEEIDAMLAPATGPVVR